MEAAGKEAGTLEGRGRFFGESDVVSPFTPAYSHPGNNPLSSHLTGGNSAGSEGDVNWKRKWGIHQFFQLN